MILSRLTPPPLKEIALETANGHQIPNAQLQEISQFERNQFRDLERKYGAEVTLRSVPTPRYNCHGMTFATRRTGIFETSAIRNILSDDSYEEIEPDDVLPGDVILYVGDDGDVEHSGIVVSIPKKPLLSIPLVCSKWGKYAEFLHRANFGPYNFANARYYRVKP